MTAEAAAVDLATLEIIESALLNIREEMDAVVLQSAMSPIIREQHDEFPLVTDAAGNMLVGQFGSYVPLLLETFGDEIRSGDVILQSDPYLCGGAIQHTPDWLVLSPIDFDGERVGYASMFGHVLDCGGTVPGSMAATATSIWDEGIRIPPVKLFAQDRLNADVLRIILNNSRTPEMNEADLMALVAACRTAATRVQDLCRRFGTDTYRSACDALLARTRDAMAAIIARHIPTEPMSFTDVVDDDGQGNGPFEMKLTVWREGEKAYFDWTGTDDPSAWLTVPDALDAVGAMHPDGWLGVRRTIRDLCLSGRRILLDALGIDPPAPDDMIGAIASVPVPPAGHSGTEIFDPLMTALEQRHRIQVPVFIWPAPPERLLRISAHLYNDESQYRRLADAVTAELGR